MQSLPSITREVLTTGFDHERKLSSKLKVEITYYSFENEDWGGFLCFYLRGCVATVPFVSFDQQKIIFLNLIKANPTIQQAEYFLLLFSLISLNRYEKLVLQISYHQGRIRTTKFSQRLCRLNLFFNFDLKDILINRKHAGLPDCS